MNALRRYIRSFTGFERDARIFLLTTLVYGVALSLWWVNFNLYLTALGFDPAFIGIAGTAGSAAGVVAAFPASILADRFGRRLVLAFGTGGATLAIAGLLFTTEPVAILLLAAAMGAADQPSSWSSRPSSWSGAGPSTGASSSRCSSRSRMSRTSGPRCSAGPSPR